MHNTLFTHSEADTKANGTVDIHTRTNRLPACRVDKRSRFSDLRFYFCSEHWLWMILRNDIKSPLSKITLDCQLHGTRHILKVRVFHD